MVRTRGAVLLLAALVTSGLLLIKVSKTTSWGQAAKHHRAAEQLAGALAEMQDKHSAIESELAKVKKRAAEANERAKALDATAAEAKAALEAHKQLHGDMKNRNAELSQQLEEAKKAPPPSKQAQGVSSAEAPRYRINVFVNLRLYSLRRLCESLLKALIDEPVSIVFLMEAGQPAQVHDYVYEFEWPHGSKQIIARHSKGGLINAIVESWYPASENEWVIFLEDDIEVSQHFLEWTNNARAVCESNTQCIGISLYSPMMNELVKPKVPISHLLSGPAYMSQLPCSWGAAYKPDPWRLFRRWVQYQDRGRYVGDLNLGQASGWAASWKRYLLELMLVKDWFVLYPYINNDHAAYSTNHLEVGEHIKTKNDSDHRAEHYTFPLLDKPPPKLERLPKLKFDHLYGRIRDVTAAMNHAAKRTYAPRTRATDTTCVGYNAASHEHIVSKGLTLVMGHFYTHTRFAGFLRNILTYCTYGEVGVKRIVVVWHNKRIKPPTMATCPGKGVRHTTVHFLTPTVADTLSNRFTPTYRILTDIVVTVDDDIVVSAKDLARMAKVLRNQNLRRVVSPFPRWYDSKLNYLWLPNIAHLRPAALEGYPFVLTKLHLSNYQLYHDYYCKEEYAEGRKLVASARNGEDILYMKAAADKYGAAALYVVTIDPVYDTGVQGLHNRSSHNRDRSAMVRLCEFNTSTWAKDMVHAPGTDVAKYSHPDYVDIYKTKLIECADCVAARATGVPVNLSDPFRFRMKSSDPYCGTGIKDSNGLACCMKECGICGGGRCDLRPGGSEGCCGGTILKAKRQCSEYGPPCLIAS
mmetsp:Transcript_34965/g.91533  ORF Transcript_34965/g.91533 Transcript_34965/m.91533 type:complete len:808 (+) Transcript_34965:319-2742(+)|eukprot:CAMPEP_0182916164 /NCGR_PEP_ID=MMETSP0105_2-20130417/775_1 /TAXON_ID=81532 ORGANISM="Acanthoeca-like sp., Strain 10tr" /NCGR_SAMPLE_ID=MMETSP0105_2 /ASSEMBLY_ACC=CAM_ASM_000205 /LENGTH=807 /DNA_ID=CAMNT_0025053093 /DNA_START=196 /DNA_END=2619 /DNA_ORIENTATION=-